MTTGAWETDLAKVITGDKEVKSALGITIGTVITTSPLKISVLDGVVILQSDVHDIYISDRDGEGSYPLILRSGDNVLLVADDTDRAFFVIDKIKKV